MNPELVRNVWLELTPPRLIAMPLVLAIVFALVATLPFGGQVGELVRTVILLIGLLWGSRRAADAVPSELSGRTWDAQRLSAIGPWAMCWGKLLGATSFAWYGVAAALVGGIVLGVDDWGLLLSTVLLAALAQAVAFFASLVLLRAASERLRGHTTAAQITGIVAALVAHVLTALDPGWYGLAIERQHFWNLSLILFLGWTLFGAYRAMRVELQVPTGPIGYFAFLAFLFVYAFGFRLDLHLPLPYGADVTEWFAGSVLIALIVPTGFLVPKDPVRLRLWFAALREGAWNRALDLQPAWATAAIAAVVGVLVTIGIAGGRGAVPLLGGLGFALRDLGLLYALTLGVRYGRGHVAAFVLLVLLYSVVPALLDQLGLNLLAPLFYPKNPAGAAAGWIEAAGALALAWLRWKRLAMPSSSGWATA